MILEIQRIVRDLSRKQQEISGLIERIIKNKRTSRRYIFLPLRSLSEADNLSTEARGLVFRHYKQIRIHSPARVFEVASS